MHGNLLILCNNDISNPQNFYNKQEIKTLYKLNEGAPLKTGHTIRFDASMSEPEILFYDSRH